MGRSPGRSAYQDRTLRQQTAEMMARCDRDGAQFVTLHVFNAVVGCQTLVEHREVGIDDL